MALRIYNERGELVTADTATITLLKLVEENLRILIDSNDATQGLTRELLEATQEITRR